MFTWKNSCITKPISSELKTRKVELDHVNEHNKSFLLFVRDHGNGLSNTHLRNSSTRLKLTCCYKLSPHSTYFVGATFYMMLALFWKWGKITECILSSGLLLQKSYGSDTSSRKIYVAHGESKRMAQERFAQTHSGNFNIKDGKSPKNPWNFATGTKAAGNWRNIKYRAQRQNLQLFLNGGCLNTARNNPEKFDWRNYELRNDIKTGPNLATFGADRHTRRMSKTRKISNRSRSEAGDSP